MSYVHPTVGLRFYYVMPASPPFKQLNASYHRVAETHPWFSVLLPGEGLHHVREDRQGLYVFWHMPTLGEISKPRNHAKVAFVYTEPLNPVEEMSGDAKRYRENFLALTPYLDLVFVHTLKMKQQMQALVPSRLLVGVLPACLDESAIGRALELEPKYDLLFYGAMTGKRLWTLEALLDSPHAPMLAITQKYGAELQTKLNESRANLYLVHSDVTSFSTWRIWQTLHSAACLVAEGDADGKVDAWPLTPGRHYVSFPKITKENVDETAKFLKTLDPYDLRKRAQLARDEVLPSYNAAKCLNWIGYSCSTMRLISR